MADKLINNVCYCKRNIYSNKTQVICIFPCEHLIHSTCYKNDMKNCKICNQDIKEIKTQKELHDMVINKQDDTYLLPYIDIMSLYEPEHSSRLSKTNLIIRSLEIFNIFASYPFQQTIWDYQRLVYQMFMSCNIYLEIKGEMKRPNDKQVIIANHSSFLDPFILFCLTGCGFVGSSTQQNTILGNLFTRRIPVLGIERGKSTNTVSKITEFLDKKYPRIGLFPEGIITHHKTLSTFRSGAFHTGFPVQPVVIKYTQNIYSGNQIDTTGRIMSQDKIIIEVVFMDIEEPPFDNNKIQLIRKKMADEGGFLLSRISNRLLKD
jgi:1-acyl-sn-glycerol-3-phosphate acyltransferase